ncbi:hypothetical protein, partial [Photobacterium sanguinicancri]
EPKALPACSAEKLDSYIDIISSGRQTAEKVVATASTRYTLTDEQHAALMEAATIEGEAE